MLLYLSLFLFESILTSATLEDDLKGLLPPISADHSPSSSPNSAGLPVEGPFVHAEEG